MKPLEFVSNRNIVVRSAKSGMSVKFVRDVPTYVPPVMHAEVMEKGIMPIDAKGKIIEQEEVGKLVEIHEPLIVLAPEDSDERSERILDVIKALVKRNNSNDFTGGGIPSHKSITAALGWKVDVKEVKRVWEEHRRELLHGEEE